jgi:EAL domain-containing protein (putative c-di-GMP-specific phosphodiesterase class I)/CheY-like chemotaxis protein
MNQHHIQGFDSLSRSTFGRRKMARSACICDSNRHVRTFLGGALEELGYVVRESAKADELSGNLDEMPFDLVVIGLSGGGVLANAFLTALAMRHHAGKVLLVGRPDSPMVKAVEESGRSLGLVMLPLLATPYRDENLRQILAVLPPAEPPPSPPIDVAEALHAGWLELWYQPKIDLRTLAVCGAEALVRIRHPAWGIVPPAYFLPDDGDPHFHALSEFVVSQAVKDWHSFVDPHGHVEIAVNLPVAFLGDPEALPELCRRLPNHPAFKGMIIEINGTEIIRNLEPVKKVARQLRFHDVSVSIDDLGAEWPSLLENADFPFAELKVDRKFVDGCADNRLKQVICHRILELAADCGARTVAEGVETKADFLAVREMGFDVVQGFLFAKPMSARKFARTMLGRTLTLPE